MACRGPCPKAGVLPHHPAHDPRLRAARVQQVQANPVAEAGGGEPDGLRLEPFSLTRFLPQISLRNLRNLDYYANRYPPRIKSGAGFRPKTLSARRQPTFSL